MVRAGCFSTVDALLFDLTDHPFCGIIVAKWVGYSVRFYCGVFCGDRQLWPGIGMPDLMAVLA